eukprot:CAMPEP_0181303644 /NCGR_PEP_ID=MMETSP1101-20121128/8676_1 /TAXON_ID=46948 /ORGANISM="Rhodomonas abbreviata, Strain Caron Lab Isolate" /LENGTH=82 /DNA_ID=CAMNT_0023409247 /DNA_START=750 /DNA_END=998 /DNA_ORIENTATION=-
MTVLYIPLTWLEYSEGHSKSPTRVHFETGAELVAFCIQVSFVVSLMRHCGNALYELNIVNCCVGAVLLLVHAAASAQALSES